MKYLFLFLVSTSLQAGYWEPHEKELAALEWKAAHSPQERLAEKFSKLENMDYVKEFEECEMIGYTKLSRDPNPKNHCISL